MKIEKTEFDGILLIKPDVYHDERGYFLESFRKNLFESYGIPADFLQDNISRSKKNTIRGLHYQIGEFAQGKLCTVIYGKVLDIAVDIRFDSPTFGKHLSLELSADNNFLLWIPPGFAHGFSVLSEEAVFYYKCTNYYSKEHERSIYFADEELNIDWKVEHPLVSHKDMNSPKFRDIEKNFSY